MRIALTGGFGSGKTTVGLLLRRKGARLVDSDTLVHGILSTDRGVKRAIRRRFGDDVFDGAALNRARLGKIVFSDPAGRRALERIVHPVVRREIRRRAPKGARGVIVVDIPLLFESGWKEKFDAVVVVTAGVSERIRRLKGRGFSPAEARRRMRAQLPMAEKLRRADHVIDNGGTKRQTQKQIDKLWTALTARRHE